MNKILILLEWGLLLTATLVFTITETYETYVTVGIGLLLLSFIIRIIRTKHLVARTGLEFVAILFVGSALVSIWAAYNTSLAMLQFARILCATTLFYAVCDLRNDEFGKKILVWLAFGFILASALLAILWSAQFDFSTAKYLIIGKIGTLIQSRLPMLPGPEIHPNVAAGTLAIAIPFGVSLTWLFLSSRRRFASVVAVLLTFVIFVGFLLTSSRSAFLGLGAALLFTGLAWMQRRWFPPGTKKALFWGIVLIIILGAAVFLVAPGNFSHILDMVPDPNGAILARPEMWSQGLNLVRDYMFTGLGLQNFYLVYSTYTILIHVPFIAHAHNFLLEVWIEQGIVGAIAMILGGIIVLSWAWKALDQPKREGDTASLSTNVLLGWAGLIGLLIVTVHGVFDVVFYFERTLPVLGFTTGMAYLAAPQIQQPVTQHKRITRWVLVGAILVVITIGCLIWRDELTSAVYANLGAVAQAKAELRAIDGKPFDNPTLDEVRRTVDTKDAEAYFSKALSMDPENLTALQRLASLDMSRGVYAQALVLMERAWLANNRDNVTRLLYGDALVANNRLEQAAVVLRGISSAEGRLLFQSWYRYNRLKDYQRAKQAAQTVLLLNPTNAQAIQLLKNYKP